jgi:hypothetical protein
MEMNRKMKFVEYKQIDNQLINIFINDWIRIVNDGNRNKNCPNYKVNKVTEWEFLSRILG